MWFCQKLHPPVLKTSVYEGLLIRRLDTLKKKAIFKGNDLRLCAEAQLKINKDYSELRLKENGARSEHRRSNIRLQNVTSLLLSYKMFHNLTS